MSMIAVFAVLSVCSLLAAFDQSRQDCSMPLSSLVLINEGMALMATLVYGIFAHFTIELINRLKNGH